MLLAALCTLSADAVCAATYYISSSDPNASDSKSGLSAAAPWRTLEKLHASWNVIAPGDSVLLKRGDYWAPSFPGTYRPAVITPTFSKAGTADAYITLGAYGTGSKPVISRRNFVYGGKQKLAMILNGIGYFVIRDLEIHGDVTLSCYSTCTDGPHHVRLLNLTLDGNGVDPSGNPDPTGGGYVFGDHGPTPTGNDTWEVANYHDLEIGHSVFRNVSDSPNFAAIHFYSAHDHVWVHHNEIYGPPGTGVLIGGGDYITYEYNLVVYPRQNGLKIEPCYHTVDYAVVRGNVVIRDPTTGPADMQAGNRTGIMIVTTRHSQIYNNTVYADKGLALFIGENPIYVNGVCTYGFEDNLIANNVLWGHVYLARSAGATKTYADGTVCTDNHPPLWERNRFSHGLYFNPGRSLVINEVLYDSRTTVVWNPATGYWSAHYVYVGNPVATTTSFGTNWAQGKPNVTAELYDDPDFVNAHARSVTDIGDFHLQAVSPARNSGASMAGYAFDYDGTSVPQESVPDRGALEYDGPPPVADVGISQADSPDPVAQGEALVYALAVTNHGPEDKYGVVVTDTLDARVSYVSANPSQGACTQSGVVVTCLLGSLAVGASAGVTVVVRPLDPGLVTSRATVASGGSDPVPANDAATETTTVDPGAADLALSKVGPQVASVGSLLTYTISVANQSASGATLVEVNDPTPTGLVFVSNAGDCATAFPCRFAWIPAGATRTFDASFQVPAGYQGPNPIVNTAVVTAATADPDGSDNSAAATTPFNIYGSDLRFFTLGPCRAVDTRSEALGGPTPLAAGEVRVFPVAGRCGVPPEARAIAVNVTVTKAGAAGNVRVYPAGSPVPQISSINYGTGQTRANNAVVSLSVGGEMAAKVSQAAGTVHLIVDVAGYFE